MKKILVTGSYGLIGCNLLQRLKSEGYQIITCDIRCLDNSLDFADEKMKELIEVCDGIVHLASISRVITAQQNPELCKKVNIDKNQKFLTYYANSTRKPWLIFASSREVYGEQNTFPVTEKAKLSALNIYAEHKLAIESQVFELQKMGLQTTVLRFSNVYGGMLDHFDRVVPAFCLKALCNETIYVEGEHNIFDFTYIDDVVNGIYSTIKHSEKKNKIDGPIHFTTGYGCSLEELYKAIIRLTDSKSKIEYRNPRNFDVSKFYGSYNKAKQILDWQPKHTLGEGLSKFISDLQNTSKECPYNLKMEIYENIKSYSWLPSLL